MNKSKIKRTANLSWSPSINAAVKLEIGDKWFRHVNIVRFLDEAGKLSFQKLLQRSIRYSLSFNDKDIDESFLMNWEVDWDAFLKEWDVDISYIDEKGDQVSICSNIEFWDAFMQAERRAKAKSPIVGDPSLSAQNWSSNPKRNKIADMPVILRCIIGVRSKSQSLGGNSPSKVISYAPRVRRSCRTLHRSKRDRYHRRPQDQYQDVIEAIDSFIAVLVRVLMVFQGHLDGVNVNDIRFDEIKASIMKTCMRESCHGSPERKSPQKTDSVPVDETNVVAKVNEANHVIKGSSNSTGDAFSGRAEPSRDNNSSKKRAASCTAEEHFAGRRKVAERLTKEGMQKAQPKKVVVPTEPTQVASTESDPCNKKMATNEVFTRCVGETKGTEFDPAFIHQICNHSSTEEEQSFKIESQLESDPKQSVSDEASNMKITPEEENHAQTPTPDEDAAQNSKILNENTSDLTPTLDMHSEGPFIPSDTREKRSSEIEHQFENEPKAAVPDKPNKIKLSPKVENHAFSPTSVAGASSIVAEHALDEKAVFPLGHNRRNFSTISNVVGSTLDRYAMTIGKAVDVVVEGSIGAGQNVSAATAAVVERAVALKKAARRAEEARAAAVERAAAKKEAARIAEQAKVAELAKLAEEAKLVEKARIAMEAKLAAEAAAAEEARRFADETKRVAEAKATEDAKRAAEEAEALAKKRREQLLKVASTFGSTLKCCVMTLGKAFDVVVDGQVGMKISRDAAGDDSKKHAAIIAASVAGATDLPTGKSKQAIPARATKIDALSSNSSDEKKSEYFSVSPDSTTANVDENYTCVTEKEGLSLSSSLTKISENSNTSADSVIKTVDNDEDKGEDIAEDAAIGKVAKLNVDVVETIAAIETTLSFPKESDTLTTTSTLTMEKGQESTTIHSEENSRVQDRNGDQTMFSNITADKEVEDIDENGLSITSVEISELESMLKSEGLHARTENANFNDYQEVKPEISTDGTVILGSENTTYGVVSVDGDEDEIPSIAITKDDILDVSEVTNIERGVESETSSLSSVVMLEYGSDDEWDVMDSELSQSEMLSHATKVLEQLVDSDSMQRSDYEMLAFATGAIGSALLQEDLSRSSEVISNLTSPLRVDSKISKSISSSSLASSISLISAISSVSSFQ